MSMDRDSKTEEATPKRREKTHQEGNVAVSRDVVSMAVLLVSGVTLWGMMGVAGRRLVDVTTRQLGSLDELIHSSATAWLVPMCWAGAAFVIPVAAAGAIAAIGITTWQTKGLFTTKVLIPDLAKLDPLPKLKQMFFSKQAVAALLQSTGKLVVIGALTIDLYTREFPQFLELGQRPVIEIIAHLGATTVRFVAKVLALLLIFAAIDFLLTRRRFNEQIKMTKQEVREEHRESEGDPEIRGRQRRRARELGRRRMMAQVPKADVVLVNPTHYAVALRYDALAMGAPRVVAKGQDAVAARIRELARKHQVPVIQNPPLTRKLFAACDLEQEVPQSLYSAVAEVLAVIYRLRSGAARPTSENRRAARPFAEGVDKGGAR